MRSRSWSTTIALVFAAALLLAACDIFGTESYVELGIVVFDYDTSVITAPGTVSVGEVFTVGVTTWGGGCTEVDRTEVETIGVFAHLTLYDRTWLRQTCPGPANGLAPVAPHTAPVQFDYPGIAQIRVTGRRFPFDLSPGDSLVTLVRDVVVVR